MSATARTSDEPLRDVRQTQGAPGEDFAMRLEDMARVLGMTHQGVHKAIKTTIRKLWRRGLAENPWHP